MMKTKTFGLLLLSILTLSAMNLKPIENTQIPKQQKGKIIYIYDAYCGWCYGFSPVITAFHQKYKNEYAFDVLSGGLITGERVGPMDPDMAKYIKSAIPRLVEITGVQVSEQYMNTLGQPERKNDSMEPAKAMVAFKKFKPNQVIEFAGWLQKAQFIFAKDLTKAEIYREAAVAFEISPEKFISEMEASAAGAKAEFTQAQQWGITGFPAVVLDRGDTLIALSNGFTDLPNLELSLQHAMEYQHK
jgi:putative protein-disulfide isomerase